MADRRQGIVIANLFPNPVEKTRGLFVWQETQRLRDRHGHDLRIISPLPWVPAALRSKARFAHAAVPAEAELDGFRVHYARHLVTPRIGRSCYGRFMTWGLAGLFDRMQKERPADYVLAHYAYPDGYAAMNLARRHGLPLLVKVRGSDINVFTKDPLRRRLTLRTLNGADRVVAVSEALKRRMVELGLAADKVTVVPNGVDLERFGPRDRETCRRELDLAQEPFTFLFVGYLGPIKGVENLLEAFRAMPAPLRGRARLLMLGAGELREELASRIEAHGLAETVQLVNPVPHDEIPRWLGACDCLVLPSINEGYPNVAVESLAAGRPVVASRVGGLPEIVVDGKSGILVPAGEVPPLTEAMTRMIEGFHFDPDASAAARRSWDDVADDMDGLIRDMMAERKVVA